MSPVSASPRQNKNLVFIHSLFRAGSTYLFYVFRRSKAGYRCYQEPLHEISFYAKQNYELLLKEHSEQAVMLRHPRLEKPYFFELYEVAEKCLPNLRPEAIYDAYFTTDGANFGIDFWASLINESPSKPIIQECRTSSRLGSIKASLGGYHIYLWRNPWDQWWSHKVTDYFDAANQMIINSPNHPDVIARLRREIAFTPCEIDDIGDRFDWFKKHKLAPQHSYLVLYILWFLALKEGHSKADILLNVDRLSDSSEYRRQIIGEFANKDITSIDFSDCSIPQASYIEEDRTFFKRIEDQAHGMLLLSGTSQSEIEQILTIRHQYEPKLWSTKKPAGINCRNLTRDAERARRLVLNAEAREVQLLHRLGHIQNELSIFKSRLEELTGKVAVSKEDVMHLNEQLVDKNKALAEQEAHNQWLRKEWDISRSRLEELTKELDVSKEDAIRLNEELVDKSKALAEHQTRSQLLQSEWEAAKNRLEELVGEFALTKDYGRRLNEQLSDLNRATAEQQVRIKWLQTEWASSKIQLQEREEKLIGEGARSQWLQNEWNAAKAQIDGYNYELQYIYNSKSWKVTLPFRYLLKLWKWFIKDAIAFIMFASGSKSRQILKSLIIYLRRRVSNYPRIKIAILRMLTPFPSAKERLINMSHPQISTSNSDVHLTNSETLPLAELSPRARKIYIQLKSTVEKNREAQS